MYEERLYRKKMQAKGLVYYRVVDGETDLQIASETDETNLVMETVATTRKIIMDYGNRFPTFINTLEPLGLEKKDLEIIKRMKIAAASVTVGPMAAVAGALSVAVGKKLLTKSKEVIVENGGDLFIKTDRLRLVAIDAGKSAFKDLALKIRPSAHPLGICTSSGTRGHSLSFGKADVATVISEDVYLADAAATALGNRIKTHEDIPTALAWIKTIRAVKGALVIVDNQMGAWGEIELD